MKRLQEKIKELRNELRAEKDAAEYFRSVYYYFLLHRIIS